MQGQIFLEVTEKMALSQRLERPDVLDWTIIIIF